MTQRRAAVAALRKSSKQTSCRVWVSRCKCAKTASLPGGALYRQRFSCKRQLLSMPVPCRPRGCGRRCSSRGRTLKWSCELLLLARGRQLRLQPSGGSRRCALGLR